VDIFRVDSFLSQRRALFNTKPLNDDFRLDATAVDELQAQRMQSFMACTISGRWFFRTTGEYMGVGPARLRVGNCISGFLGGQVLYAIRSCKQERITHSLENAMYMGL
jgi:hypothetical protein